MKLKRSSDNYVQFKKKITNPGLLKAISAVQKESMNLLTPQDICWNFLLEGAKKVMEQKNIPTSDA